MTILLLMYEFFKTGLFSVGGGLATLPFLYEMSGRHPEWFTGEDIADMIAVSFQGGMSVSFKANKAVSVGGILNVDPDYASGEIPYSLENVDVFR